MSLDEYASFDAAYVWDSLSRQDRLDFEAHLPTCDQCAARVAEMRQLTQLLALAPEEAFADPGHGSEPSLATPADDGLAGAGSGRSPRDALVAADRSRFARMTRRRMLVGAASMLAAAACVIAVIAIGIFRGNSPDQPPPQALTMANLVAVPLHARAQVVTTDTWAQINIWCTYNAATPYPGNYQAVARSTSGQSLVVGSWPGVPGQTAVIRTPTHLHTADLASIDIVSPNGTTLARLKTPVS